LVDQKLSARQLLKAPLDRWELEFIWRPEPLRNTESCLHSKSMPDIMGAISRALPESGRMPLE
jgi:hypothetical protein